MGRIKALLWGALFSFGMVSSIQALTLEIPVAPWADVIIGTDPGVKLGIPFVGGTAKHTITVGTLYRDTKWAMQAGSKVVVNEFLGGLPLGYTFSDTVGKQVTGVIAVFWEKPELRKKLKEFYDIKQQLNGVLSKEERIEVQKKCIVVKHTVKVLMA